MTREQMIAAAVAAATKHGLPPQIICGIAERESTWNPWTIRYEPAFFTKYMEALWTHGMVKDITEAQARSFSWGLMQVMGQTARELGWAGDIAALCDPEVALEYGCRAFAERMKTRQGNAPAALLAYNGGANPNYADEVLKLAAAYPSKPVNA
jgi:soluble lytic murein transglycosylase-like protein